MYSKEFISKVKSSADIVALVGELVQLRRTGKQFTGLSPFTKEKTPSFFVNPDKQIFKCYSTQEGGDVFSFFMKLKAIQFPEAVAFVAEKIGMALEEVNKSPEQIERDKKFAEDRKTFLKLNRFAAKYFQDQFEGPEGGAAREYAAKRGISKESLLEFGIGFAPESWTGLRDMLAGIKAPMIKAHAVGLLRARGGAEPLADGSNLIDTFRNRLIFPIRDPQGEVIGFGGRFLGANNPESPKYINSPESPVYEKEKVLYNLDLARKSIRELETVVLVEGYMDCLALVQAGFTNAVANCGTALTRTQVGILRKIAPKVICLYDSDRAGQAAMEKAMDLFLDAEGIPILGARLPDGKDPDEFLREHGSDGQLRMAEILQNSPALVDDWIANVISQSSKTLQGRTDALNKIAAKLAKLRDDLAIQARLSSMGKALELDERLMIDAVRKYKKTFLADRQLPPSQNVTGPRAASAGLNTGYADAKSLPAKNRPYTQNSRQIQGASVKRDFGFQRRFLSDLLKNPTWIESLRQLEAQKLGEFLLLVDDAPIRQALEKILEPLAPGESEDERVSGLVSDFREQAEIRNLLAEATKNFDDSLPPKDLDGALKRLMDESLRKQAAELQVQIKAAEAIGDSKAIEAHLLKLTELRRRRAQN